MRYLDVDPASEAIKNIRSLNAGWFGMEHIVQKRNGVDV